MTAFIQSFRIASLSCVLTAGVAMGQTLSPEIRAKVEAKAKLLQNWSTDAQIVSAVKANNANPPAANRVMTNEQWKSLTILDPFVRSFSKNPLALHLREKKDGQMSECFVSGADGTKVAFLSKTTSWSHRGKDKHMVPMTGKTWIGSIELDESTGLQEVQIGLPVLDGGMPIGSIVIGLNVATLR